MITAQMIETAANKVTINKTISILEDKTAVSLLDMQQLYELQKLVNRACKPKKKLFSFNRKGNINE